MYCLLQDLKTKEIVAKGKVVDSLYILDNSYIVAKKFDVLNRNAENRGSVSDLKDVLCDKTLLSCNNNTKCFNNDSKGDESINNIIANISCSNDPYIWHKRLAHISDNALQHIKSPDIFIPPNNRKGDLEICEVFHKAKKTRLPFPTWTNCTLVVLVHMDL